MRGATVLNEPEQATKEKAARECEEDCGEAPSSCAVARGPKDGAEADVELPLFVARSFAIQQQEPYQQQGTDYVADAGCRTGWAWRSGDQVEFFFDGERTVVKPVRRRATHL